jgi:hypothetical protein
MSASSTNGAFLLQLRETQLQAASRTIDVMHKALTEIAALKAASVPSGSAEDIARRALASLWDGPCFHGRTPVSRCDTCESMDEVEAWTLATRAELGISCNHEAPDGVCLKCGFIPV